MGAIDTTRKNRSLMGRRLLFRTSRHTLNGTHNKAPSCILHNIALGYPPHHLLVTLISRLMYRHQTVVRDLVHDLQAHAVTKFLTSSQTILNNSLFKTVFTQLVLLLASKVF